jgi:hypothetical protein
MSQLPVSPAAKSFHSTLLRLLPLQLVLKPLLLRFLALLPLPLLLLLRLMTYPPLPLLLLHLLVLYAFISSFFEASGFFDLLLVDLVDV